MPHAKHWPSVYPDKSDSALSSGRFYKVSSAVLVSDAQAINSVAGQIGAISHIIDHAVHHTANAIRANKLSYLDSERFIEWICQRTFSEFAAATQGEASDDRRGAESIGQSVKTTAYLPAGTGEGAARQSVGEGGVVGSGGRGRGRGDGGRGKVRSPTEAGLPDGRVGGKE